MGLTNFYSLKKNLVLYRNRKLLFKDESTKNYYFNHIILSIYEDPDYLINLMNSNLIESKYFRGYFIPRADIVEIAKKRRFIINQKLRYDEIKDKLPNIKYTKLNLSLYGNQNTLIDTYPYLNLFNQVYSSKRTFNMKLPLFLPYMKEILSKIDKNKKVIIPIIPTTVITTGKEWTFENIIYYLFKNQLFVDYNTYENITFIYTNKTGNIFFKFKLEPNFNLIRYKRITNILCKINSGLTLTKDEQDEVDSTHEEEENTKETLPSNENISGKLSIDSHINTEVNATNLITSKLNIVNSAQTTSNDINQTSSLTDKNYEKNIDKSLEKQDFSLEKTNSENFNSDDDYDEINGAFNVVNLDLTDKKVQNKLELLKAKQKAVKFKIGKESYSLNEILKSDDNYELNKNEIPVETLNKEVQSSNLNSLNRTYLKSQNLKDFAKVLTAFNNDKECPVYVTNIEQTDTSNSFTKKNTYKITLEDAWGVRHTLNVDIPIVLSDNFIYVEGNKKIIGKQMVQIPIIKTKPDEVCITTNYNKMYVYRIGQKTSASIDKLKKYLLTSQKLIKVQTGNNIGINKNYLNSLEYDDLSKSFIKIDIRNMSLFFNRRDVNLYINETIKINLDTFLVENEEFALGYDDKNIIVVNIVKDTVTIYNTSKKVIKEYPSIVDLILDKIKDIDKTAYDTILAEKTAKRFLYTRTRIIGEFIPLIIVLGFYFGLEKTMSQYNIDYEFLEKRKRLQDEDQINYSVIQFKDGFLYYNSKIPRNSILMNGLLEMPTKEIEFSALNDFYGYLDYFDMAYGSRNKSKGFKNNLDLFLDPKTVDVLKYLKLPSDLLNLLLYANTLLDDNTYTPPNNMKNYRIRSIEMINGHFYKLLADAVKDYKDLHKSGRKDVKISLQQDSVIKNLVASPIVEDYSVLSPIFEAEKIASTTYKGLAGTNLDSAFTKAMRAYDKSMIGIIGFATPDSDKVGVVRTITYDPKINNVLGTTDISNPTDLDATNLFTTSELMTSFTALHADPPRIAMQTHQNKHIVPTKKQTKPLYGSGIEKTIAYNISKDFINVAEQDGVVESINTKNELAVIKYKDNTREVIDLSDQVSKNSSGGFYISNQKELLYKKGQKFKQGDIIARNPNYFLGTGKDISYAKGLLVKVAIHCGDFTLEDSSIITEDVSKDMTCDVTMMKKCTFGPNTNIKSIVKKHQHIKSGQPLIVFEHSFDDADANKMLDSLDDSFAEFVEGLGVDSITSKYTGEIVDIKLYWNVDESEFSPSIKKLIKEYRSEVDAKRKILAKSNNDSTILPITEKINSEKIKGVEVEGLIIEFYIRHENILGIGDKIAYETALKTIVSDVIPKGQEPYSEYHKDEPIQAILSPMSVISRMTVDIYNLLYMNKLIIEMKRKTKEIWES